MQPTPTTPSRAQPRALTGRRCRIAWQRDRPRRRADVYVDESTEGGTPQTNNVVSNQFVNRAAAVKDWIASPRAWQEGRLTDVAVPAPTPLWTPQEILAPLGTMKATPGDPATTGRTSLLTSVLGALNPFAGNSPWLARCRRRPALVGRCRGRAARDRCRIIRCPSTSGADDRLAHLRPEYLSGQRRHHRYNIARSG